MKKLSDLFDCWYGVNLELVNCQVSNKGIPFVSRTSNNNGVVARVELIPGIEANPAHTLSLAGGGSVLSCFYQDEEYYSGRDLFILSPKETMTKNEMLLYSYIIEANKYKYNYGRQANKTFRDLMLPELSELKNFNWNDINSDFKFDKSPKKKQKISLSIDKWKWFKLDSLFSIEAGCYYYPNEYSKGETPYCSASISNNGVGELINLLPDFSGNKLIIGKIKCSTFYQPLPFCATSDVNILTPKFKMSIYIGLFIATVIENSEGYKWNYGRQCRINDTKNIKIKLPVDSKGDPDWQFMEDYIKSLPYSSNL